MKRLIKLKAIGTGIGVMALFAGCRTEPSPDNQVSEIVTENASNDSDAIVHRQTVQGLDMVVYRQCLGISTEGNVRNLNGGCTKFTAKDPEVGILYSDFISSIARQIGVDVTAYRAKSVADYDTNEVKLAEVEKALSSDDVMDVDYFSKISSLNLMTLFRFGIGLDENAAFMTLDYGTKTQWYAPFEVPQSLAHFEQTCAKAKFSVATPEFIRSNADWLTSDRFLTGSADGKPTYGKSGIFRRILKGTNAQTAKLLGVEAGNPAVWVAGESDFDFSKKVLKFPVVKFNGSDIENSEVSSTILAASYGSANEKAAKEQAKAATTAFLPGLCHRPSIQKLRLGVTLDDKDNQCLVLTTQFNSPARKIGILPGDVVAEIGGRRISSSKELIETVASWTPDVIPIKIFRGGKALEFNVNMAN